jgi:hypothetical protein
MEIIQIGSIAILQKWLVLGISVIFGLLFLKIWFRRTQKEENKKLLDLLSTTLFIGFFIWKASLIVFEPTLIWESPFSLLYFTGGSNGLVLAITFSMIYFIYKAHRKSITQFTMVQTGFLFSFVALSVYHSLAFLFHIDNRISHFFLGALSLFILIICLLNNYRLTTKWIFSSVIIFSFVNLIFSFTFVESINKLFLFTAEQWLYIILIIFSLIFWDKQLVS